MMYVSETGQKDGSNILNMETNRNLEITRALKINSLRIIFLVVVSGILVVLNIYKPIVFSRIIDYGLIEKDWDYILLQCSHFLLIALALCIFFLISNILSSMISNSLVLEMKSTIMRRIFQTDYRLFIETDSGDMMNRIDGDVKNIRSYILSILNTATGSFLGFVSAMLYIGIVQWKMIVVGFLATPFVAICLYAFKKKIYELERKKRELQSEVFSDVLLGIDKQIDLRSLGLRAHFLSKTLQIFKTYKNASVKSEGVSALNSRILELLGALGYIVTISYGGWLVLSNQLSIGHLFAFLTLRTRFLAPIDFFSTIYKDYYTTKASIERLLYFFSYPLDEQDQLEEDEDCSLVSDELVINVENMEFRFNEKEDEALFEGLNATFPCGWTRIEGINGAGKTTFALLLLGVLNPQRGEIYLNGRNSKTMRKSRWRERFSFCSQKPFLFSGTLRENVSILNPEATDVQIRDALKKMNFNIENGNEMFDLDQHISEDGKNLSSGQRQKVALARTILKNAEIYIFDEAIANVDSESKVQILDFLRDALKDKIVIWISHENWEKFMDFSFIIKNGKFEQRENLKRLRA